MRKELIEIRECERKAHTLYDTAVMNLVNPDLSREECQKWLKTTYQATELHAKAMAMIEELLVAENGKNE